MTGVQTCALPIYGLVVVPQHPGARIAAQKRVVDGHVVRVGRNVAVAVDGVADLVKGIFKQTGRIDGFRMARIDSSRISLQKYNFKFTFFSI